MGGKRIESHNIPTTTTCIVGDHTISLKDAEIHYSLAIMFQVYISSSEEERKCSKDYSCCSHHWGMWKEWDSPTEEAGRRKQQHAYNATNHEHIPMC